MNKYLEEILRQMCSYVEIEYSKIDFKSKEWYYIAEWTKEQEDEFVEWLTNYLYTNHKASSSLYKISRLSKKKAKECAEMFNMNYGWKRIN